MDKVPRGKILLKSFKFKFFFQKLYLLLWIPDDQKHQHVLRNETFLSRNKDFFRKKTKHLFIYNLIHISTLIVDQFVCPFASNKRQNGWADWPQWSKEDYDLFRLNKFSAKLNEDIYYIWKYTNININILEILRTKISKKKMWAWRTAFIELTLDLLNIMRNHWPASYNEEWLTC